MSRVVIFKSLEWPNNLMSAIFMEHIRHVTQWQCNALNWGLDCCANASSLTATDAQITRMFYEQHLPAHTISETLGLKEPVIAHSVRNVEAFLRTPLMRQYLEAGFKSPPDTREDLYAYGIPVAIIRTLHEAGILRISQLRNLTPKQLQYIPLIAAGKAEKIRETLADCGIILPETPPENMLQEWQFKLIENEAGLYLKPWECDESHRVAFDKVMAELPPHQRGVLIYRYRDGLIRNQIAEKLTDELQPQAKITVNIISKWNMMAHLNLIQPHIRHLLIYGKET